MTEANKRKGLFAQVVLLISSMTGVGFSSGHEIWSFFGRHGFGGLFSVITMPVVLAVFIYMTLTIFGNKRAQDDYKEKCRKNKLLQMISNIIDLIVALFIGIIVVSMISAAGDVINQLSGIPLYIGCIFAAVVVFSAVVGGSIRYVTSYLSFALPVILTSTIVICVTALSVSSGQILLPRREFGISDNWLISLLLYVSYNMLVVRGVASSISETVNKRKHAFLISVLSATIFGTIAVLQFIVETKSENIGAINGFQMVHIAHEISPVLATAYRMLILISAIGTAIACFYAFISKLIRTKYTNRVKQKKLIVLVAILCCIGSLIGFANINSIVYPLLGTIGLISLVTIVYRYYAIKNES